MVKANIFRSLSRQRRKALAILLSAAMLLPLICIMPGSFTAIAAPTHGFTFTECGYPDAVEYAADIVTYVSNPSGSDSQQMSIKAATNIRTEAYDASDSPILLLIGADGFDAADAPGADSFGILEEYARRAIWEGWVVVEPGNRAGVDGLVDLKAAVRYIRDSDDIPGNKEMIFVMGGDYAALLGTTVGDASYDAALTALGASAAGDSVYAIAVVSPSADQTNIALSASLFNEYVVPSALAQMQKVFANNGYAGVDAYLAANSSAGMSVTYNNGDIKANATNVVGVSITQTGYNAWAGTQPSGIPVAGLGYDAGSGNVAPNWFIREDVKSVNGNAAILALATALKAKSGVNLVNSRLVWDNASVINSFFDFGRLLTVHQEIRTGDFMLGLESDPLPDHNIQLIPGTNPAEYYKHYDTIWQSAEYYVWADIPFTAYEYVPTPYVKVDDPTTFLSNELGYYQRMDIYQPTDPAFASERQPVVVFAHGGGGVFGDKCGPTSAYRDAVTLDDLAFRSLMLHGFTSVSVNYRFSPGSGTRGRPGLPIPGRSTQIGTSSNGTPIYDFTDRTNYLTDGLSDVRAAIRWLKENADMLNIDPDRIIIAGASAGAAVIDRVALIGSNPAVYANNNADFAKMGAAQVNDNLAAAVTLMTTMASGATGSQAMAHGFAPAYYFATGERDGISNWRTQSVALYNRLIDAGNTVLRNDVIEGGNHERRMPPDVNEHFLDVWNVGTMFNWLYDIGIMNNDPGPVIGPENFAFSIPYVLDEMIEPSMNVKGDLDAVYNSIELNDNPGIVFSMDITGSISAVDNVFTGKAADEYSAILYSNGTTIPNVSYVNIDNWDDILRHFGIKDDQWFTIREVNPALNAAYGAGSYAGNQRLHILKLESLSEISDFNLLLMDGTSTITLTLFDGRSATGNARCTITIRSDISVEQGPVLAGVSVSAFVTKLSGNTNELTITVVEELSNGEEISYTETFSISNNAADSYEVGEYTVYVDTKGNDQIRACYFIDD